MTEYLIAFNDEWVPDYTEREMAQRSEAVQALRAEMKAAGVYVFLGGLDDSMPVFSVDASSGAPVFTDGPYTETKEHLGGFTIVDVADEQEARMWAGKCRDRLRLAARGAELPSSAATFGALAPSRRLPLSTDVRSRSTTRRTRSGKRLRPGRDQPEITPRSCRGMSRAAR